MATQKASIFEIKDTSKTYFTLPGDDASLRLVVDPYSGKYYGSDSVETVSNNQQKLRAYYTDIVTRAEAQAADTSGLSKWGEVNLNIAARPTSLFGMNTLGNATEALSPADEARQMLTKLSTDITKGNYVQQDQMVESYQKYGTGWDKFFETSYKSPRLQEDNAEIAQQNANAQGSSGGTATGNQLISSNLGIRKETGTGVGKSTVGLNPFGKLDAGLNI